MAAPRFLWSRPAGRESHRGATTGTHSTAARRSRRCRPRAPQRRDQRGCRCRPVLLKESEARRPFAAAADRARSRLKILRGGAAAVLIEEVLRTRARLNGARTRLNRAQARWWRGPRARWWSTVPAMAPSEQRRHNSEIQWLDAPEAGGRWWSTPRMDGLVPDMPPAASRRVCAQRRCAAVDHATGELAASEGSTGR